MDKYILEEFSIHGLNDESDVTLKFIDNMKIVVSENGFGKTTIISLLYSFLKKSKKTNKFNFKSLSIKAQGGNEIVYPKEIIRMLFQSDFLSSLESHIDDYSLNFLEEIKSKSRGEITLSMIISLIIYFVNNRSKSRSDKLSKREVDEIKKVLRSDFVEKLKFISFLKKSVYDNSYYYNDDESELDFQKLYTDVTFICKDLNDNKGDLIGVRMFVDKMIYLANEIEHFTQKEFIYLPTYRLVESDISSFERDDESHLFSRIDEAKEFFRDNPLIQFGVESIKNIWDDLSNRIRISTTEDFIKLSGVLLKNIVSNKKVTLEDIQQLRISRASIEKILSRLDQNTFDEKDRNDLLAIIDKKNFESKNSNQSIFYILENMVTIYNNQKHIDEAIEKYRGVINSFFNDKKVVFNEITSEIYVEKTKNKRKIDIENLSSGEKQILSLFTKIYLADIDEQEKKYWIFYDEPEISLSIEWQEILLPKIMESGRCEFMLAATHSPFIFKNDLKIYTSDLALEVSEVK